MSYEQDEFAPRSDKMLDSDNEVVHTLDPELNALKVAIAGGTLKSFLLQVSMGLVPGYSHIEKYGESPDVGTADLQTDVWDYK